MLGQALGMGIGAFGAKASILKHSNHTNSMNKSLITREMLASYCLPLAAATGFIWIQMAGYRLVLNHYWGLEKVAYIAVALGLSAQLWGLCESLASQYFYPMFYKKISSGNIQDCREALSDLLNILGPVFMVIAGATMLTANLLLVLFVDSKYSGVGIFVMVGALIECCRVIANLFSNAAQATRNMSSLIVPNALGSTTALVLIFISGMIGQDVLWAGLALASGGVVLVSVMVFRMRKEILYEIDYGRWLFGAMVLFISVIFSLWQPLPMDTNLEKFASMSLVGVGSTTLLSFLLWKNPSLARLMSIRLR